jgi:hypothetical protein
MKIRQTAAIIALATMLVMGLTAPASATTLVVDSNGILLGLGAVPVEGSLYDVTFQEGTCASVFGVCDAAHFQFTSSAAAEDASTELLQLFTSINFNGYAHEYGCSTATRTSNLECDTITPYAINGPYLETAGVAFGGPNNGVGAGITSNYTDWDLDGTINANWAVWTPCPTCTLSGVPEPGTWTLLIAGLGWMGYALRHSRRKTEEA